MRLFGIPITLQRIQYKHKYGDWYFENEFYFEEFLNLKQDNLTVRAYSRHFRELHEICELEEDERHDLARYVQGLRPDILVHMNSCNTCHEAFLEAIRVEHMLRRSHRQQCRQRAHIEEKLFSGGANLTLVIRRLLNTSAEEEEEWRQAMKFHTRVRVIDRAANVVIDNGSAINFVAQEVIDKLNLTIEKLSKPYQVTWSNGHVIPVTHRCLVSFKLGGYEDQIWCDVIHMNIAHLLFGRPWLFDRKVFHDEKANTYTLFWNGRWSRLMPMTSTSQSSSAPSTEAPQKEQKLDKVVMIAPSALTSNIIDDIEEQVHGNENFVGTNIIVQGSATQEPQRVEEIQGRAHINNSAQVSNKIDHPVDLIVMPLPETPLASSEIKSIVPVVSQEDQVIKVPHIDFIFGERRWIFNAHDQLVQRHHLTPPLVNSPIHQQQIHLHRTSIWRNKSHIASKLCHENAAQKKRRQFVRLIFDPGGHFLHLWADSLLCYQPFNSPESSFPSWGELMQ